MKNSGFTLDGKEISYEITEDGYNIYLDGKLWIRQYGQYIPFPDLSYEEGCLKQIKEIVEGFEKSNEEASEVVAEQ